MYCQHEPFVVPEEEICGCVNCTARISIKDVRKSQGLPMCVHNKPSNCEILCLLRWLLNQCVPLTSIHLKKRILGNTTYFLIWNMKWTLFKQWKPAFFAIRGRKSRLSVLLKSCYIVSSIKMFLHTTEPLTPVSSRDHPHILCACQSTLSNSSSATRIHGQLLLLKHAQIHCLRLHRQPDLCTSIIIMHSRNSNSLPYFRAEEHWTNFPLLYAAQTRHGNLFWLCLFIGNALVNLKNMKENVFVLPAVPLSIFSSIECKNKMKFELLGAYIQIPCKPISTMFLS